MMQLCKELRVQIEEECLKDWNEDFGKIVLNSLLIGFAGNGSIYLIIKRKKQFY